MPAIAGMTEPEEVVFRREEAMDEIARDVVVALVVVDLSPVKFWNVEEAFAKSCWNEETAEVEVAVKF